MVNIVDKLCSLTFGAIKRIENKSIQLNNQCLLDQMNSVGDGCRLVGHSQISAPHHVTLERNVHIGEHVHIRAEGGLFIGENTHISRNLLIYTLNHNYEGDCLPYDHTTILKGVTIERNVWIGMNVCIVPGSHIEEGAIIGMGAVVAGHIPKGAIAGGNPAKVLKYRDMERYERLLALKRYGGKDGILIT